MDTKTIPDEAFALLLAEPTTDPLALVKEYITINKEKGVAERRLKELKPLIDALRGPDKKTFLLGKFRNIIGKFVINHIESTQAYASIDVLDQWLASGKITKKDYKQAVSSSDKSYNLISFQEGK